MTNKERDFDITIFGATGFTGGLTAEYLAANAPPGLRWALAGRDEQKLAALRDRLGEPGQQAGLIVADVGDSDSMDALAARSRVVITTVGPYLQFGEPLVQACATHGTDYVDLTGEPEFVDRMIANYDDTARRTGARIVNCCGFDSIPHDLGAMHAVQQLGDTRGPIVLQGFVRAGGVFSGGTWHSAVNAMSRMGEYQRWRRQQAKPETTQGRRVRAVRPLVHYRKELERWACPFPTIDGSVVRRSARALDSYGDDFSYGHYVLVKRLPKVLAGGLGVGAVFTLAQVSATRKLLLKLRDQGEGPTEEQRDRGWFKVDFIGSAPGKQVHTQVSGGDPGYGETAKMLSESALCLAYDALPAQAGVLTPAVAMGDALLQRLQKAGIRFEVL